MASSSSSRSSSSSSRLYIEKTPWRYMQNSDDDRARVAVQWWRRMNMVRVAVAWPLAKYIRDACTPSTISRKETDWMGRINTYSLSLHIRWPLLPRLRNIYFMHSRGLLHTHLRFMGQQLGAKPKFCTASFYDVCKSSTVTRILIKFPGDVINTWKFSFE